MALEYMEYLKRPFFIKLGKRTDSVIPPQASAQSLYANQVSEGDSMEVFTRNFVPYNANYSFDTKKMMWHNNTHAIVMYWGYNNGSILNPYTEQVPFNIGLVTYNNGILGNTLLAVSNFYFCFKSGQLYSDGFLCVIIDPSERKAYPQMIYKASRYPFPYSTYGGSSESATFGWTTNGREVSYQLWTDSKGSLFDYKPLYNLHSSTQNFTLTTIGKTPNDGEAQITAPISDIIAFSEQSRLRAYIQNIKDNDRFVKMFTLDEHKYIGIKIDTYTNGVYEGKIGFYIDGVRQEALNLNFLSNSIFDVNNLFPYFLAISVDYENAACLPTIVYDWSDTGLTDYQCENYTAVNELYEYLHPFFGTVINPENPDIPVIDPTPTTDSETGGDGSWWTPDYEVGVPEIYEYGVADCGFMSLYRMTEAQMRNLASYLWSDDFLDNVKKFFNDPMQMIVCARMIPYTPNSAQNTSTIKAGNVDTTCVGYKIDSNNQYTKIDCGQVRVEPRGDTYMDYSPYCSASIYLPFVGVRPLDVDLIMGHDIGVEYTCDCLTGQSVCFVKIGKNVAYTYECTVGADIPISSQSYGNVIGALSSALTMPISAGTMLATGGMSAPMMPTMLASASIGVAAGTSIAQNTRETISHSGNVTGIGGMLSYKKPILYMEYTNPINAKNQKHFLGAPAHKNMVLKNCNGLTIVKQIFIELEEATDDEKKELSAILESGVIV